MELNDVVCIDTETGHWQHEHPAFAIHQFAMVTAHPDLRAGSVNLYLKPIGFDPAKMRPDVMGVTGITPGKIETADPMNAESMLCTAAMWNESGSVVAGHNVRFDLKAIEVEAKIRGRNVDLSQTKFIDTFRLVREIYDEGEWIHRGCGVLPDFKLATCFYGIVGPEGWEELSRHSANGAHDALTDALMVAMLVEHFHSQGISVDDMVTISAEPYVPRLCPLGNQKGKSWDKVELGFLKWMVDKRVWIRDTGETDEGLELAILTEAKRRNMF
jgi:DNA polymerase III epsilon subunit-like protein